MTTSTDVSETGSPVGSDLTEKYLKNIRNFLGGIFIVVVTFALDFGREFLLPVTLAFFIALTFRPTVRKLHKHNIPGWLATAAFMTVVIIAGIAAIYTVSGPIADWVSNSPTYIKAFAEKLTAIRDSIESFINFSAQLQNTTDVSSPTLAVPVVVENNSPVMSFIAQGTGYSADVVTTIVLTLVIAAFMMASGDLFYEKLIRVMPTLTDKKRALRIVYDVEQEVSAYLLIVTAINAGLGIAIAIAFYFLGMPAPWLWGIFAFLFNFIPYVGALAGIALSGFMAVTVFDSLTYALAVPLAYAVINGLENQFVTPVFLGRRLQMNSVAILLALTFWSWEWGIAGTMLAVPILVTVKVFCDHLDGMKGVGEFLSERQSQVPDQAEP